MDCRVMHLSALAFASNARRMPSARSTTLALFDSASALTHTCTSSCVMDCTSRMPHFGITCTRQARSSVSM